MRGTTCCRTTVIRYFTRRPSLPALGTPSGNVSVAAGDSSSLHPLAAQPLSAARGRGAGSSWQDCPARRMSLTAVSGLQMLRSPCLLYSQ